jgi:hypothetical protein
MHPSSIPDPSATAHGCARPSEGALARPPAGDRRPYPNAPTWTRPSYARPGTPRRGRSGPTPPPPIPSTVWTCPPEPRDTRDAVDPVPEVWARATLAAVLAAFTTPGAGVGVLPWPHPTRHAPTRTPPTTSPACVATGAAADDLPGPASALDVIAAAGRVPTLLDSCPHTGPDADLAPVVPADPVRRIARPPAERSPATSLRSAAAGSGGGGQCGAARPDCLDLIITGVEPEQVDDTSAERVALAAARRLRLGGILVTLTHCDHAAGALVDPGGAVVAAAQNADLLYLQHIVVLTDPRPGPWPATGERPGDRGETTGTASPIPTRGSGDRPMRHDRAHSDLYVFGQPHDHTADDPPPLGNALPGAVAAAGSAAGGQLR